jgi:serine/threonine protein kinase/WD40 repeat protein
MSTSGSESRSGLVMELAEEFLDRYRKGERPALREYIENHPELAADIREVFPAMAMMEKIALADESLEADATGDLPARRLPPLEQLGDYRIVREVGRGGMGVVYEAEQVSLGRHVALKVLPPQMLRDAKTRRRFEREARAAAKLHHTNIVPVFGVGEQGETPYYVMQFIQGQGLDCVLEELRRLRTGEAGAPAPAALSTVGRDVSAADVARSLLTGRLDAQPTEGSAADNGHGPGSAGTPGADSGHASSLSSSSLTLPGGEQPRGKARRQTYWQGVARIGVQVADALAYAHAQGIVHRDVKPSNLLLDTHGIVWVTDFGLAKADDQQNLTHTGDILGTLRYMPPEAFGGKVDTRGDVYALGLTLYEMLAFRPAFDEKERGRLVKQVTNEAPAPLQKLNPEVPRDLETIVQKAIEREPSHRYASASELADDLRRFVDDEPIRARRASYGERLARWARRNPAIAALGCAVALLSLAVMCGLWYGNQSARRALKIQTELRVQADQSARQADQSARRADVAATLARAEAQRADTQAVETRRAADATEAANRALTSTQDSLRRTLYAARLNLAQLAWDSRNASRTLELLEATRPGPGEPDFRGFEWGYYQRQTHGEGSIRKLPGFLTGAFAVVSPDGAFVASVQPPQGRSDPIRVVIHETATGSLYRRIPLRRLSGTMRTAANYRSPSLTFSGDGTRLALVIETTRDSTSGTLRDAGPRETHAFVWNLADERELFHDVTSYAHVSYLSSLIALTYDGARLALGHYALEYSNLDTSNTYSGDLRVVDLADGRERLHLTSFDALYSLDISPDGRLVAIATSTIKVGARASSLRLEVLDVESGQARTNLPEQAINPTLVKFSPSGLLAVITSNRNSPSKLVVCDLQTGRAVATEPLAAGVSGRDTPVAFSPDGRFLLVAARISPVCQVRELPTGRLVQERSINAAGAFALAVRPSDGSLLTLDRQGNLREWDSPSARRGSLDAGHVLEHPRDVALAGGGREVVAVKAEGDDPDPSLHLAVHDAATGQVLRQFVRQRPGNYRSRMAGTRSIEVSAEGSRLALLLFKPNSWDVDHLEIWDVPSGRRLLSLDGDALGVGLLTRPSSWYRSQALDAAGSRFAVLFDRMESPPDGGPAFRTSAVSVFALPSGRLIRTITNTDPAKDEYKALTLSPDGRLLALAGHEVIASGEGRARIDLLDLDSGRVVRSLRSGLFIAFALVFSPDGRRLALCERFSSNLSISVTPDRVEVWDLSADAAAAPLRLDGHQTAIGGLAFSADGRRLATIAAQGGPNDCEVKLWDLTSGRDLVTWPVSGGNPMGLAFDPDGRRLRVLLSNYPLGNARLVLFDATPPAPAVEAVGLVDRLGVHTLLNTELAANVEAEPSVDPAVRAAALEVIPRRQENCKALMQQAGFWLVMTAAERTPELMRRALACAERAAALVADLDPADLETLGEARYRNGHLAECLDPLRQCLALREQDEAVPWEPVFIRALAFIAMAEAKLGHRALAQAAMENYRTQLGRISGGSIPKPVEGRLLFEAEAVLREAFPPGGGSETIR